MKLQKKLIPDILQLPVLLARLRPEWKIIGPVADIRSASAAIRSYPDLDLIFADIRLEDGYSFEVFDAVSTDALTRFERRTLRTGVQQARSAAGQLGSGQLIYRRRLEMNRGDSTVIVDVEDLVYAEYDLGMVRLWCRDGVSGIAGHSLSSLQEELDPAVFMWVSRNHLVRLSEVGRIRSTLGRNKILSLKPPFEQTEIVITAPVVKALREKLSA